MGIMDMISRLQQRKQSVEGYKRRKRLGISIPEDYAQQKALREMPAQPKKSFLRKIGTMVSQVGAGVSRGATGLYHQPSDPKARTEAIKRWRTQRTQIAGAVRMVYSELHSPNISKKGQGYSHPGRPRGTYIYSIPGKGPVSIYVYRKWARQQRSLAKLQQGMAVQQMPQQFQQFPHQPQQFQQQNIQPQAYRQQIQPQLAQMPIQQPISYPQPQQVVQQPRDYNILHAPNPFKGELRNVGMNSPLNANNVNVPVTNPQGSQYVEIDPMSGRPILKNRHTERWLSG